jgi:hypothetical protein
MAEINATAPPASSGLTAISTTASATDNTSRLAAMFSYIIGQGGGSLYIPTGTYKINGPLLTRTNPTIGIGLTLRGDGPGCSVLRLDADVAASIFSLRSDENTTGVVQDLGFFVKDIGFETTSLAGVRKLGTWFHFYRGRNVRFDRVLINITAGTGIEGFGLQDSNFTDVHLNLSGSRETSSPMLILAPADNALFFKTENVVMDSCRLESNFQVAARLIDVQGVHFRSCKFHGRLIDQPQPDPPDPPIPPQPAPVDSVEVQHSHNVFFTSCRFANSGLTHIRSIGSSAILVDSSSLDGAKYPGIDLLGCTGTVIVDNNFAAGPSGTPGNGQTWPTPPPTNILEVECAETVRKNNTGTAVNT